jgi:hemolysin-activating ACP:hemolysin acyltransferase
LDADDWTSGENLWLLDTVAVSRHAASAVVLHFSNVAGKRRVQLHPIVARTVDPKLLEKLK